MTHDPCAVIILAAGKGTRMKSTRAKILHEIAGRPMVLHALDAVECLKSKKKIVVVSPDMDDVTRVVAGDDDTVEIVVQPKTLGTGHAVQCAAESLADFSGNIIVLFGDTPLMTAQTLQRFDELMQSHDVGVIGFTAENPTGYGRLIRNENGNIIAIREHKDASAEERDIDLNLTDLLSSPSWTTELDDTITYWLKPIGVTDSPVEEGRLFTELDTMLNFSKLRPNGVTPNNILIAYGVGSTKILAIYRVTSFPEHVTQEQIQETDWLERWPWYVTGNNLTPNFGGAWWTHNLYINTLKDQYLAANPDHPITAVGGPTLGALNFGKDKLKLSPDFARYIIDQVVEINDRQ